MSERENLMYSEFIRCREALIQIIQLREKLVEEHEFIDEWVEAEGFLKAEAIAKKALEGRYKDL